MVASDRVCEFRDDVVTDTVPLREPLDETLVDAEKDAVILGETDTLKDCVPVRVTSGERDGDTDVETDGDTDADGVDERDAVVVRDVVKLADADAVAESDADTVPQPDEDRDAEGLPELVLYAVEEALTEGQ